MNIIDTATHLLPDNKPERIIERFNIDVPDKGFSEKKLDFFASFLSFKTKVFAE
jgi:hypothetical protein